MRLTTIETQPLVEQPIAEARITGGMNSFIDPADIPNGVATVSSFTRTYADYTYRALGATEQTGTKPDSLPVLLYCTYKRFDGSTLFLRFTKNRIDKWVAGAYTNITGTALTGADTDRIRFITSADASNDYLFFTNNGVDEIQVLNAGASTFADLGNAPKYRHACVFFNRVVGVNLAGSSPNPVLVGWSGDLNYTQWNPLTDISAGSTPLVEAQSDYADPITGVYGFAQVMLLLRERSLWIATKRPVASNPFQFQAAFPSVGCDTPFSATQTRNGIIWYDYRTNQVYLYEVGSQPQPVGDAIRVTLRNAITDVSLMWGSYDNINNTYFLTVPTTASTTARIFVLNLNTGSWSYDDRLQVYGVYPLDGGSARLVIDQGVGTINSQVGTINNAGVVTAATARNYFGYRTGEISYEDAVDTDTITASSLQMEWRSKIFRYAKSDMMISSVMLLYQGVRNGSFSLQYCKNGGAWQTYKTITVTDTTRRRAYLRKLIRANEFQWRVTSSSGDFKLLEFRIDVSESQEDK